MLWIVSVKAFNRATGMQIDGQYAVCAQSREEAVAWVVAMFEQTDVQFVVDAKRHASGVLVLEMKQRGRSSPSQLPWPSP
jgi:hypothetical protein